MRSIVKTYPATAYINLEAIKYNCRFIKSKSLSSRLLAVVKGDAYGHGLEMVCRAIFSDVDGFIVGSIDEAIKVRKLCMDKKVLLIKGVATYHELYLVDQYNLDIVVYDFFQIEILEKYQFKNPLVIWLKIDTGMHRLGFMPDVFAKAYEKITNIVSVSKPIVIMTHFSNADDFDGSKSKSQFKLFNKTIEGFDGEKSVANSNAILAQKDFGLDWMRIGGALYGVSTMLGKTGKDLGLKPAMTLVSRIIAIQKFRENDDLGYGKWKCPEDMLVGVVDLGYADGYPRVVDSDAAVIINYIHCKVIGIVSMNMLFVDLRKCTDAKIGDTVILWGRVMAVEKVASSANTFCLDLLCRPKNRIYSTL